MLGSPIDYLDTYLQEENLHINKQKSGIVQFRHRKSKYKKTKKKWREDHNYCYKGYLILTQYRYLGTILNEKLTCHPQAQFIRTKAFFIGNKLQPLLYNSTLESRYNLWQIFIAPLFEYIVPLLSSEDYNSNVQNIERLQRSTFRQFTFFRKTVPEYILDKLMNYKLKDRMALFTYLSEKKWACRKNGEIYIAERDQTYQHLLKQHTSSNGCKGLPNQFVPYVNILTTICPLCPGHICSGHHLKRSHNMNIQTPEEII